MEQGRGTGWKRAARAIWNGPFYIGHLQSPASVGDVLLKTLETTWRALVSLLALLLAFAAAAASWIAIIEPTFFPPLSSKIEASVRYDDGSTPPPFVIAPAGQARGPTEPFQCTPEFPLAVRFSNKSQDTVGKIAFEIKAYRQGYSEPLSQFTPLLESNAIIPPGYLQESCWSGPDLPQDVSRNELIYRVEIFSAAEVDPALASRLRPLKQPAPAATSPAASPSKERTWGAKAVTYVGALLAVGAIFLGGSCLLEIVRIFVPTSIGQRLDNGFAVMVACIANSALIAILSYIPLIHTWVQGLDRWSRNSGYADAATLAVFTVCSLWTLPALLFLSQRFSRPE